MREWRLLAQEIDLVNADVVVSSYPRTELWVRTAPLRTGVKRSLKERIAYARHHHQELAKEIDSQLNSGEHQFQRRKKFEKWFEEQKNDESFHEDSAPFVFWYEAQSRDYAASGDKQLCAGFSDGLTDQLRKDFARTVFGVVESFEEATKSIMNEGLIQKTLRLVSGEEGKHYRFWPRCIPWKSDKRPMLDKEQIDTAEGLLMYSVSQALAGPAPSDVSAETPDFFVGRRVSELAVHIFRAHLFRNWRRTTRTEKLFTQYPSKDLRADNDEYDSHNFAEEPDDEWLED